MQDEQPGDGGVDRTPMLHAGMAMMALFLLAPRHWQLQRNASRQQDTGCGEHGHRNQLPPGTNVRQELAADPSRRSKTAVTADSFGILVYQLCQIRWNSTVRYLNIKFESWRRILPILPPHHVCTHSTENSLIPPVLNFGKFSDFTCTKF